MSGVLKRTIHYEFDERPDFKCVRFSDWNTVITSLGVMMEPSQLVPRETGAQQLDWLDSMTRIHEMAPRPHDSTINMGGSDDLVTGYHLMPRKGR